MKMKYKELEDSHFSKSTRQAVNMHLASRYSMVSANENRDEVSFFQGENIEISTQQSKISTKGMLFSIALVFESRVEQSKTNFTSDTLMLNSLERPGCKFARNSTTARKPSKLRGRLRPLIHEPDEDTRCTDDRPGGPRRTFLRGLPRIRLRSDYCRNFWSPNFTLN